MNNTPIIIKGFEWFGIVERNKVDDDFPYYDIIVAADVVCCFEWLWLCLWVVGGYVAPTVL